VTLEQFYADVPKRMASPEWDFGVNWYSFRPYPLWRVSWVVETGEVYAYCGARDTVRVLGIVPPVGEYPWSAGMPAWTAFKDAQQIETVMDGWAEGDFHKSLAWVEQRLVAHGCESVARRWRRQAR